MKAKTIIFSLIFAMSLIPTIAQANVGMRDIMYNGKVKCGMDISSKTYGYKDKDGYSRGMAVELCKAYATAFLGKEDAYEIVDSNDSNFEKNLESKKIDIMLGANQLSVLVSNTTPAKEVDIMTYDTQALLVRTKANATDISSYKDEKICISTHHLEVYNLKKFIESNKLNLTIIAFKTKAQAREAFILKRCNILSANKTYLISVFKNNLEAKEEFEVLSDIVAIRPLYIFVRSQNTTLQNSAKWVFNALKISSDVDIHSGNIEILIGSKDLMIQNLLGDNKTLWEKLDVKPTWLRQAVKSTGNYQEIYERNLGELSDFGLNYPYNQSILDGGSLTSEPFL